ncbi:MAG: hypothetical protein ACTHLY_07995 [Pseudolabrys sp.]
MQEQALLRRVAAAAVLPVASSVAAAVAAAWLAAQPEALRVAAVAERPAVAVWQLVPARVETAAFPAVWSRCGSVRLVLVSQASARHSVSAPSAAPDAAPVDFRDAPGVVLGVALGVALGVVLAAVRACAQGPARPALKERPWAVRRAAQERPALVLPAVGQQVVLAAREVARAAAQPEVVRLDAAVVPARLRADGAAVAAPVADAAVAPAQRARAWLHPAYARRACFVLFRIVLEVVDPAPAASCPRARTTTWRATE